MFVLEGFYLLEPPQAIPILSIQIVTCTWYLRTNLEDPCPQAVNTEILNLQARFKLYRYIY